MPNLVLYRKYRPKNFSEVVGQEHIVRTLTNAVSSGKVSHAYLFSGPRGSGKTTLARILAKAVNCQNPNDFEPCNHCPSCLEINQGQAIDLIEIDAASHRGVDEVRELREGMRFSPTRLKYKVFIIDECHQLSKDAANALLKMLEEPPSHTIFVLATTEIHKMIPTIVSRCQSFNFRKLTVPEIVKKLETINKQEGAKIERAALELIASNASGSIRDAETLLDQVLTYGKVLRGGKIETEDIKKLLGLVDLAPVSQLLDLLIEKNGIGAVNLLNEVLEKGKDPYQFSKTLIDYLRRALILKISLAGSPNPDPDDDLITAGLTQEEKAKLQSQVQSLKEEDLRKAVKLFLRAENEMKYSSITQLPLELAIIEALREEEK